MVLSDALWQVALTTDDEDAVRAGLAEGKSPHVLPSMSVSPMDWAIQHGSLGACRLLLAAGAPVDPIGGHVPSVRPRTALLTAVSSPSLATPCRSRTVTWLLGQGAHWDPDDGFGKNPFVVAMGKQDWPCAHLLWRSRLGATGEDHDPSRRQAQCLAEALKGIEIPARWWRVFVRHGVFRDLSDVQLWSLTTAAVVHLQVSQAHLWFGLSGSNALAYTPGDMPAIGKHDPQDRGADRLWEAVEGAAAQIGPDDAEEGHDLGRLVAELKRRGVARAASESPLVARIHAGWLALHLERETPVPVPKKQTRPRM